MTTDNEGKVDIGPLKGAVVVDIRHISFKILRISYEDLSKAETLYLTPSKLAIDEVVVSAN